MTNSILKDKSVVLVVTGGIAAYKSPELARLLVKAGARVRVAMTGSAAKFITPLTFETLTQSPVAVDLWSRDQPREVEHISLADWGDLVIIAPATANIIAKMAHGLADDFASTFLLAVQAPILVCPAMNIHMFENAIVQSNLKILRDYGFAVMDPASGFLACGYEGKGRMPEPAEILEEACRVLSPKDLAGLSVLVTSGPTREPWDDIRFLSNRSTGRMGFALAKAAWLRGARVTLITGPVDLAPPYGVETIPVETTQNMFDAVMERLPRIDILVKAAAPADFRPAEIVKGKIKKGEAPPPIRLTGNPDILLEAGRRKKDQILVGFAAEAENLIENAKGKLHRKNLDLIVANRIGLAGEAFGADTNRVWLIDREETIEELPLQAKEAVAGRIWDRALDLYRRIKH